MRQIIMAAVCLAASAGAGWGFDYEGHRLVNQLALESLPPGCFDFARTPVARERVAFLGGEADRWRNSSELSLQHVNHPDHFLDVEDLAPHGLALPALSPFRYEFVAQLAAARAARPAEFEPIEPAKNLDRSRHLPGFLPWTITEYYAKLKSCLSYLKTFEADGEPGEVANARENVIYVMGVMGHFVADAAQPLHTTRHYNGWTGPNPAGYTTNRSFHAWIDGGFLARAGLAPVKELRDRLRPAEALWKSAPGGTNSPVFGRVVAFIADQHKLVEPLYRLEKDGKLAGNAPAPAEGKAFLEGRLVAAAQMLGDLWVSAWQDAGPDLYLKAQLAKRKLGAASPPAKP